MKLRKPAFIAALLAALVVAAFALANAVPTEAEREVRGMRAEARLAGFKFTLPELEPAVPTTRREADLFDAAARLVNVLPAVSPMARTGPTTAQRGVSYGIADSPERLRAHGDRLDLVRRLLLEDRPVRVFATRFPRPRVDALADVLAGGALIAIHAGRNDDGWADLLALNALAARLEPGPAMDLHDTRCSIIRVTFATTWEAVQAGVCTDARLAELERLWRDATLFGGLEEIPMLQCAKTIDSELRNAERFDTFREIMHGWNGVNLRPAAVWARLRRVVQERNEASHWRRVDQPRLEAGYIRQGVDSVNLMRVVLAQPDWPSMKRDRPTNGIPQFSFSGTFIRIPDEGGPSPGSLFGKIVQTEAARRILLAALAVERAKLRLGRPPASLSEAGFTMADFMTGEPPEYRLEADGTYHIRSRGFYPVENPKEARQDDIVWPRCVPKSGVSQKNASP